MYPLIQLVNNRKKTSTTEGSKVRSKRLLTIVTSVPFSLFRFTMEAYSTAPPQPKKSAFTQQQVAGFLFRPLHDGKGVPTGFFQRSCGTKRKNSVGAGYTSLFSHVIAHHKDFEQVMLTAPANGTDG
jgi:hypothetical protein